MDINIITILYRLSQEAVNNAVKYSKATKIIIYLAEFKSKYSLKIKDNGIGFNVGGLGIIASISDGGDSILTLGDSWTISAVAELPGTRQTLTKESVDIVVREKLC